MDLKQAITSPLPKRLKAARFKAGISQKNLGILAGIDEFSASARVNQYEKGKHAPDFQMAGRFAQILKVPSSYLFEADDGIAEALMMFYQLGEPDRKAVRNTMGEMLQGST